LDKKERIYNGSILWSLGWNLFELGLGIIDLKPGLNEEAF